MKNRKRRRWTKHEDEYLREAWGKTSVSQICKALGRSFDGIYARAYATLKLGHFLDNGEYIPLYMILKMLKTDTQVDRFLKKHPDFPYKKQIVRSQKKRYAVVKADDFWRWLSAHPDELNIGYLEPNAIGGEPAWADAKRKADYKKLQETPQRFVHWKKIEDVRLAAYVKQGLNAKEIARRLNRTVIAVMKRVPMVTYHRLPQVKKKHFWSADERAQMADLFMQGMGIDEVTEAMGLEREQVVAQMWVLYRTRNAERLRNMILERGVVLQHGPKKHRNGEAKAG